MNITLTKFEMDLLNILLAGEDTVLSLLRKQLLGATIPLRKQTDAGFYLFFDVSEELPRIPDQISSTKDSFCFGDVDATISGLQNGASFLIWVKNGYLKQLEGYTYGEKWPTNVTDYTLRYRDEIRNITQLRKAWLFKQS
jgi:hypothetical protein